MAQNDDDASAPEATGGSAAEAPRAEAPAEAMPADAPTHTPPADAPAQTPPTAVTVEPSKKKKKAKKPKDGAGRADGEAVDAAPADDGSFGAEKALAELPGKGTPDGETLRDARVAFEIGDYKKARELAASITRSEDRDVAAAAEDVLRRTGVDQVQIAFLVACTLAILTIAWIYIPH